MKESMNYYKNIGHAYYDLKKIRGSWTLEVGKKILQFCYQKKIFIQKNYYSTFRDTVPSRKENPLIFFEILYFAKGNR